MFPQAALLLAFITEQLGDAEPLPGFLIRSLVGRDHARECGRHLGTQRNLPLAFVLEIVKLADDFRTALGSEEFEGFEWRTVVLPESIAPRNRAPFVEDKLARVCAPQVRLRQRFGVKITESR